jgi:hypothetical protein
MALPMEPKFARFLQGCPFQKSYLHVSMMQPSQDRNGCNDTGPLDCRLVWPKSRLLRTAMVHGSRK